MSADNQHLSADQQTHRTCSRCGGRAWLILRCLDPKKGKEVRLYKCQSGEVMWDDQTLNGSAGIGWLHISADDGDLSDVHREGTAWRVRSTSRNYQQVRGTETFSRQIA